MRRLRPSPSGVLVGAALLLSLARPALGFEPQFALNTPPGITTGLQLGANPPPGLYLINLAYYARSTFEGGGASTGIAGLKAEGVSEAPILFWTTPWTVLGASWAMFVATPASRVNLYDDISVVARVVGFANPGFSPVRLSWNLGGGWFAKLGVVVWAPLGTIDPGPFNNGLGNIGAPFWTIEQHAALSYLGTDWNATANLIYGIPTENTWSHVTNGNWLNLDLTATRKFGRFEIGPVGYLSTQTTPDSGCEAFYGPGICARGAKAGVGGIVGYNFGPATLKVAVTDTVYIKNSFDGLRVWSTFILSLAPPPP